MTRVNRLRLASTVAAAFMAATLALVLLVGSGSEYTARVGFVVTILTIALVPTALTAVVAWVVPPVRASWRTWYGTSFGGAILSSVAMSFKGELYAPQRQVIVEQVETPAEPAGPDPGYTVISY
ncbi:hypothetical protein HGA91_03080 [candidate division WWE3 bacterium]|nr:hypothetical protein [candidate division WWE3 bacterium]